MTVLSRHLSDFIYVAANPLPRASSFATFTIVRVMLQMPVKEEQVLETELVSCRGLSL